MQKDVQSKVLHQLQSATAERDISQRIRLFQQGQEILLQPETSPETADSFVEFFANLKADPHVAIRRFAASFLEKVVKLKPSLALRCATGVARLLSDGDGVTQELSARCAGALHGRALYLLALEEDKLQFQKQAEQLQRLWEVAHELLMSGCPGRPALFRQVTRWARVCVLVQTPSPLLIRIRVPPDLRGASCLQDFPVDPSVRLDLDGVRRQAEELFQQLCCLIQEPPQGHWPRSQLASLIRCVASTGRQRPPLLRQVLIVLRPLLRDSTAVLEGLSPQEALPVPPADAGFLRQLIWDEIQLLLASNVTASLHGEIVELLHTSSGASGPMEDLVAQAKYQQICSIAEKRDLDEKAKPARKRRRIAARRAWADSDMTGGADGAGLVCEEDFDADALLSGETELACRRLEDYFGLPSQREPAGHVSGPALLASRIGNKAELARLALTSLNSLAEKRFLLREKGHERAVGFAEPVFRKAGAGLGKDNGGTNGAHSGDRSEQGESELAIFVATKTPEDLEREGEEREDARRDPRAVVPAPSSRPAGNAETADAGDRDHPDYLPLSGGLGTQLLSSDAAGKDNLQLQIFDEILEARRRMDMSLLRVSLSEKQLEAFERVSKQVALHLIASPSKSLAVSPGLQRAMCRAFMGRSLDALKAALDSKAPSGGAAPLGQLAEIFYAKYTADVARSQEALGLVAQPAAVASTKTPFAEVLEGRSGSRSGAFTYAELFDMFMMEFERRELPRRELRSLLCELPMVPPAAFRMLEAQCRSEDEKPRKVALMTLLALLEGRPSCRWQSIQLLFRLAYGSGGDKNLRFDTIRLIINKIYSTGSQPPMRWQLPHLDDAEAVPHLGGAEAVAAAAAEAEAPDDTISLSRLKGRVVEDVASLMLRSMAPDNARFRFKVQVSPRVQQLRANLFESGKVCSPEDRMWLYLALCIKRPVLLHGLVETFTLCGEGMQGHLVSSVEEAIKHIPASEPELLMLVQKATPETERLVLKVLHILMQTSHSKGEGLTKAYGEAVTRLYGITHNPRLLVPVFDLVARKDLLEFLPAVLQLEKEQVADAFGQLVRAKSPPISITELLTELHHMNKPHENIVPVKASMQALNIIFSMKEKFESKVYGIVIQSLVEEPGPLPTLFMRTVIQVVKELPRLSDFIVMEILPRLLRQEVWSDENMWRGFMIVLQHTFTSQPGGAARVLAMLPSTHLEDVLVQHPDWKAQLVEFVARQPPGTVPPHVRQLLQ